MPAKKLSRENAGKIPENLPPDSPSGTKKKPAADSGKKNAGLFKPRKVVPGNSPGTSKPAPVAASGQGSPDGKPLPGEPGYDSGGIHPDRPIGNGNPPKSTQFGGSRGNPSNMKGYPKGQRKASTIIKYWLETTEVLPSDLGGFLPAGTKLTQLDLITLGLIKEARNGNVSAANALLDRTEGKPIQTNKLLGEGDKQLEITVGFKRPPSPTNTTTRKKKSK